MKILIVDDEEDIRLSLKDIVEAEGHETEQAQDGQECVEKAAQYMPDKIFLDVMMPGLKTKEVLEKLSENQVTSKIPVILITVMRFSEKELESLLSDTQVVNYVPKPFDIDKIESLL